MAKRLSYQPAGISDEDVESDIDDWGQRIVRPRRRKQQTSLLPPQPGKSTLNSKQRKSLEYWKNQKKDLPIENPALARKKEMFFMKARQRNMDIDQKERHLLRETANAQDLELIIKQTSEIKLNPTQDSIVLVNNKSSFQDMIADIKQQKLIALDIEGHHDHTYLGWIAVIQIGTESAEYLIDPFEFTTEVSDELKIVLEDSSIIKIIFDAHMEINWFWRDYQIHIRGVIDCQILYRIHFGLGNNSSLKTAVEKIFPGFILTKGETNSDWRRRPLTSSQQKYTQLDVYTLLRLFAKMRQMVKDEVLLSAIEESDKMTMKIDAKKVYPGAMAELDSENKRLMKTGRAPLKLTETSIAKYQLIHQWRNRFAQMVDESPRNVLMLEQVVKVSNLGNLASLEEVWDVIKVSAVPEKYIKPQCKFLLKILTDEYANEVQMTAIICHNCEYKGHPAVFCPLPVNKEAVKEYMKTHPESKARQNRRRHQNLKKNLRMKNKTSEQ